MRFLATLFVLLSGLLAAQRLEIVTLSQPVIEERLKENRRKPSERKAMLEQLFEEAGCSGAQLTEQAVKHAKLPNIVCTLPGTGSGVILVGAHYDHVETWGEGAVDNWTGASLLPSLYQSLKDQPRQHSFIFIGFTDEEKGLVGSAFYAQQMGPELKSNTQAMINFDSLGLSFTRFWNSHADKKLAEALVRVAANLKLPVGAVDVDKVGSSDSESFAPLGIPHITIHSVTQETLHILHSREDKPAAIHVAEYYDTYRLAAMYLAYLDQTMVSEVPKSGTTPE